MSVVLQCVRHLWVISWLQDETVFNSVPVNVNRSIFYGLSRGTEVNRML
jgi:hypothetical protein